MELFSVVRNKEGTEAYFVVGITTQWVRCENKDGEQVLRMKSEVFLVRGPVVLKWKQKKEP